MSALHYISPVLAVAAFLSGLISAAHWYQAAALRADAKSWGWETAPPDMRQTIMLLATVEMVYRSNGMNMDAARWSAITVFLAGAQSLAAAFLP